MCSTRRGNGRGAEVNGSLAHMAETEAAKVIKARRLGWPRRRRACRWPAVVSAKLD